MYVLSEKLQTINCKLPVYHWQYSGALPDQIHAAEGTQFKLESFLGLICATAFSTKYTLIDSHKNCINSFISHGININIVIFASS